MAGGWILHTLASRAIGLLVLCWFTPISVWIRRNLAGFFKVRWMANKVFRVPENISCLLLKQSYCRKVKKVCKHHIIFQRFVQQKRGVLWTVSKQAKDMKFKSRVTKLISSYLSFYGNGWKTHTKKIPFQLLSRRQIQSTSCKKKVAKG